MEKWGKRHQGKAKPLCPELCPAWAHHSRLAGVHHTLLSTFIHGPVEPWQDPVLHQGQNQVTNTKRCFKLNKEILLGLIHPFLTVYLVFLNRADYKQQILLFGAGSKYNGKASSESLSGLSKTLNGHRYVLRPASGAEDMEVRRNPETLSKLSF